MRSYFRSMGNLPVAAASLLTVSNSSGSHVVWWTLPILDRMLTGPIICSICTRNHSCCEATSTAACYVPGQYSIQSLPILQPLQSLFLILLPGCSLSLERGETNIPLIARHSTVTYSQHWASHKSPQSPFTTAKLSFCNWSLDSVIIIARPFSKTTVLAYPLGPMTKLKIPCMNSLNFCQKAVGDPAYVA